MTKHTILFLAANPVGTSELALGREARAIQVELERSGFRDSFKLVTRWAAEPLDLLRELRKLKPTVVHFSGHGGRLAPSGHRPRGASRRDIVIEDRAQDVEDGLFFQGHDGRPQRVSAEALQQTFGAVGSSVQVMVLNACYSSVQAEALRACVDCVVGMRSAIDDDAARSFAIGFYGGLGDGVSVAGAFEQGRAAISLEGLHDGDHPQLHVRAGVDAARLVLAARGDASTAVASGATDRAASATGPATTAASEPPAGPPAPSQQPSSSSSLHASASGSAAAINAGDNAKIVINNFPVAAFVVALAALVAVLAWSHECARHVRLERIPDAIPGPDSLPLVVDPPVADAARLDAAIDALAHDARTDSRPRVDARPPDAITHASGDSPIDLTEVKMRFECVGFGDIEPSLTIEEGGNSKRKSVPLQDRKTTVFVSPKVHKVCCENPDEARQHWPGHCCSFDAATGAVTLEISPQECKSRGGP